MPVPIFHEPVTAYTSSVVSEFNPLASAKNPLKEALQIDPLTLLLITSDISVDENWIRVLAACVLPLSWASSMLTDNISFNPVFLLGYLEYIVASCEGNNLYTAICYKYKILKRYNATFNVRIRVFNFKYHWI